MPWWRSMFAFITHNNCLSFSVLFHLPSSLDAHLSSNFNQTEMFDYPITNHTTGKLCYWCGSHCLSVLWPVEPMSPIVCPSALHTVALVHGWFCHLLAPCSDLTVIVSHSHCLSLPTHLPLVFCVFLRPLGASVRASRRFLHATAASPWQPLVSWYDCAATCC